MHVVHRRSAQRRVRLAHRQGGRVEPGKAGLALHRAKHPIAGNAAEDTDSALTNFDGISYAKGCSALRQLALYVGDDAFVAGVRDYLSRHSYGNATLADFLEAIGGHTDADLTGWSTGWLESAGTDEICVAVEGDPIAVVEASRTTPEAHPADRPHMLDIAGFSGGRELWRTPVFTLGGDRTEQAPLVGLANPNLLVPNASDLTWTIPVFAEATLAALPQELVVVVRVLGDVPARAFVLGEARGARRCAAARDGPDGPAQQEPDERARERDEDDDDQPAALGQVAHPVLVRDDDVDERGHPQQHHDRAEVRHLEPPPLGKRIADATANPIPNRPIVAA